MHKKRRMLTKEELATTVNPDNLREIDAYDYADKKRANNPTAGMARYDKEQETTKTYQFDPHLDPTLQWAGKVEGLSFKVPTCSIHIHESIKQIGRAHV